MSQSQLVPAMIDQLNRLHSGYIAGQQYGFGNPDSPMLKALISQGYIMVDTTLVNPGNPKQVAMALSDSGLHAIGQGAAPAAAPAPAPAQPAFAQSQPETSFAEAGVAEEATSPAAGVPEPKKEKKTLGPRPTPVIHKSTMRMALPVAVKSGSFGARPETYPFSTLEAPDRSDPDNVLFDSFFVAASDKQPNPGKTLASTVNSANKRSEKVGKKFSLHSIAEDHEFGVAGARVLRVE